MNLVELGQRIRQRRESRGLKQVDVARALMVSAQAVSKWERGDNAPDIAILLDLARLLDVTTDWLLGRDREDSTFPATVLATALAGFADRASRQSPREVAAFANGVFHHVTEAAIAHDGVPVKYLGDGFLGFFSGAAHADRAVAAAREATRGLATPDFLAAVHTGEIYLGSIGHPGYASPDIIGETVNTAFLVLGWLATRGRGALAVTGAAAEALSGKDGLGEPARADVKGEFLPVYLESKESEG